MFFPKTDPGTKVVLMSAKIYHLARGMEEKGRLLDADKALLQDLPSKIDRLRNLIKEILSVDRQIESLLQGELEQKEEMLQAKDSAIRQLEGSLTAKVHDLESQLGEKEGLLKTRNGELETLSLKWMPLRSG